MRPYNWPKFVADLLAEHYCCINFKRRKLYPHSSKYIAKRVTPSTARHIYKILLYRMPVGWGGGRSYRSRFARGDYGIKLGQSVSDLSYPSKEFHKRLANLEELEGQSNV